MAVAGAAVAMNAPVYRFKGGIRLDKADPQSLTQGIRDQPLVEHLAVPLLEYWYSYSIPVVKPGEKVLRGQLIANPGHPLGVPRYSPTSGSISGISIQHLAHPSGLRGPCITIASNGDDEGIAHPSSADYRELSKNRIVQKIYEGGVTGMGGSGFPAHTKLNTALQADASVLIINALECEPQISCDQALIETCSDDIVSGINILAQLLQPSRCVIAVKEDMSSALNFLAQSVSRHADQTIEIVTLPNIYPIGSEKLLIYCLTGRHLDANSIPAANGFVCQNVASVKAIFDAVVHGQPLTSRIITVAGQNIASPVNLRTRLGTPVRALLNSCDELDASNRQLLLGGPLNGVPLDYADAPVDAHHNCILSNPVRPPEIRVQPCINCSYCAEICPQQLLPQRLLQHTQAKQLDELVKLKVAECIVCGACDTVCPSKLPLTATFRYARDLVRTDADQRARASVIQTRFQKHQQRILALEQSRQLGLQGKSLKQNKKAASSIIQAALERSRTGSSGEEEQQ